MRTVFWIPLVAQVLVPLGLVGWLALRPPVTRLSWALGVALLGCWILVVALAGVWLAWPWWLWIMWAGLGLLVLPRSARRVRTVLPRRRSEIAGAVLLAALAAGTGTVLVLAVFSRRAPGPPVDLSFPLRGGTYLVANGGASLLTNGHLATLRDQRFRSYRGQSYGVDLVRIDRLGRRARGGPMPRDPAAYLVYGDSVIAPCAGRVVRTSDGVPDQPAGVRDRRNLTGNHVVLACDSVWVLLAHLRPGGVLVAAGEEVVGGTLLGYVGNSGNSDEPHLHIHVQTPGTDAMPIGGTPVPVRFDGRYLVRNARVTAP